jgi:hypothetical protein
MNWALVIASNSRADRQIDSRSTYFITKDFITIVHSPRFGLHDGVILPRVTFREPSLASGHQVIEFLYPEVIFLPQRMVVGQRSQLCLR